MSELKQRIVSELGQLTLNEPTVAFAEKIEAYLLFLHKWNQAYNLTAVRDVNLMVGRHILDSLVVLPWLHGTRLIDVGSGGGLPGIPLALARPDIQVVLLDSNGKKTRFLREAKRVLNLTNVEVIQSRVEDYNPELAFDTVISRAFSNIPDMLDWTNHLLVQSGVWVVMKGLCPENELKDIQYSYRIESYVVPGVEGERCCAIIEKS
ncbi:MAG: 16S rRNA (guanine(527)-N(7))-methyltransferase RsmG [Legionellaceae bacterium]|nr:16S rRNA (guanine(527)-N(7))-methyltransferase RsmG [Legionellaceae bacterium]